MINNTRPKDLLDAKRNFLLPLISIIPIGVFLYILSNNVLNLPINDDYDSTLLFLKQILFDDWKEQNFFSLLLKQHNEHRILFSRITALAFYSFEQKINFTHLIYFQNIFLIFSFFGLIKLTDPAKIDRSWIILVGAFSLFSIAIWQSAFFYYGGIQHFTSFFFGMLALFFLNKTKNIILNQFLAVLFAFISSFSFGNGIVVMPMGILLILLNNQPRKLYVWSFASLLFAFLYIYDLNFGQHVKPDFELFSFFKFFFTFLGASAYCYGTNATINTINIILCMLIGLIVFITWIYLFFGGIAKKQSLLYVMLSLCIVTGLLLAMSRYEYKAAGGIISRYNFFSKCLIVLFLANIQQAFQLSKKIKLATLLVVVGVWVFSLINILPQIAQSQLETISLLSKWKSGAGHFLVAEYQHPRFGQTLTWADEHNIFSIPTDKKIEEMKFKIRQIP